MSQNNIAKSKCRMVGDLLHRFVRHLSAWAWEHERNVCESIAELEEMHARPGSMELAIKQNPAQAQWVAQCFASMVAQSENYTEMKFDLLARGTKHEWLTVLIQKGNGKTPHQLRQEAEKERDELKARLVAPNDLGQQSLPDGGTTQTKTERATGRD